MKWIIGLLPLLLAFCLFLYIRAGWGEQPLDDAARAKAPGKFVELTDGKIHYKDLGPKDGPVVVMVHGFSTPHFIFTQNANALVEAGHRVILFDHFGRGWSDRPRTKYDVDFFDRALLDLLNALELKEPVGLVGLSMGGVIVPEFTARHPERVSKVFLFVPAGLRLKGDAESTQVKLMQTPIIGDFLWKISAKGVLLADPQYDESEIAPENRLAGDVTEQMSYEGYFEALLSSFRHNPMRDRDETFARLADAGIPVFAIFGAKDETVDIASADPFRELVPGAHVEILPEGAHGLNYQNWQTVNPMLVSFFADKPVG